MPGSEKAVAPSIKNEIHVNRRGARLNVLAAVLLSFAVLMVSNYCASILYAHWQFDERVAGGLSSRTLALLQHSQGEVVMTSLFERAHPFSRAAENLLREYSEAAVLINGLDIKVKTLNVNQDIVETAEMMRKHTVDVNSIVIEYGQAFRVIKESDMVSSGSGIDSTPDIRNQPTLLSFSAENACTTALIDLLQHVNATVYFISGHGEYDPDSQHHFTGVSLISQELNKNGVTVKKLNLQQMPKIPEDCDAIVIPGPRTVFSQKEVEILSAYLNIGGKAMILVDDAYASGLTSLIEKWGVKILPPILSDSNKGPISTTKYGDHPTTEGLENIMMVFSNPCPVEPVDSGLVSERADKPTITPLVMIPANGDSETRMRTPEYRSVAAASELGGKMPAGRFDNTRMVVCGDSEFISNAMTQTGFQGNTLFVLSSVKWLLGNRGRPVTQAIPGITLNPGLAPGSGWLYLGLLTAVAIPLAILAFGLVFFLPLIRRL